MSKAEEYKLLDNQDLDQDKGSTHDEDINGDAEYGGLGDSHWLHHSVPARFQPLWPKNSLVIVLGISATANLLLVALYLVFFLDLGRQTTVRPGRSDLSLYGQ